MTEPKSQSGQDHLTQRLEDLKWYVGVFATVISVLFAGLAIIIGLNLSSEKNSLKEYKDSLRQELTELVGSNSSRPNLVLQTLARQTLDGAEIPGTVTRNKDGAYVLSFQLVVRNDGKGRSGPIFAKYYSTDFQLDNKEIDGTGFKYETFITPDKFAPSELFGGASISYTSTSILNGPYAGKLGTAEILARYYYGNGLRSDARFRIRVKAE